MAKRVIYTDRAFADIDRIIEFNTLRNKSNTYSNRFVLRLIQLSQHPLSGLATNTSDAMLLIWDKYYIFYSVTDTSIEIASIYHQKENVSR
jgi:plasmid stabilization system protein ParE